MKQPKPVDNCIHFIEKRIRDLKYEAYQNLDSFSAGLTLGIEAGIKQANGDFKINKLEHKKKESTNE